MPSPDVEEGLLEKKEGDREPDHEASAPIIDVAQLENDDLQAGDSDNSSQYRLLPLFAGVVVPFAILLAIPSVTARWYVRTGEKGDVLESAPNPKLLEAGMILSLVCGVLANACLVVRFAERAIKAMTVLTIVFLSIHGASFFCVLSLSHTPVVPPDVLNIVALTIFGIRGRFDDGFVYGQPFWMTLCSTIISTITNLALIVDYIRMSNFASKGSGLTRKQRTLVIVGIILLAYVAFGALVQCFMLKLSFIDALYFTVATIEAVGECRA